LKLGQNGGPRSRGVGENCKAKGRKVDQRGNPEKLKNHKSRENWGPNKVPGKRGLRDLRGAVKTGSTIVRSNPRKLAESDAD